MQDISNNIKLTDLMPITSISATTWTPAFNTNGHDSHTLLFTIGPESNPILTTTDYYYFKLYHSDTTNKNDMVEVENSDIVNGRVTSLDGIWKLDGRPLTPGKGGNPGSVGLTFSLGYVGNKDSRINALRLGKSKRQ